MKNYLKKQMKIIKYTIYYFFLLLLILFFSSINEGTEVLGLSENEKNVQKTFEYFIWWVMPFWWIYLLLASIILSIITVLIKMLICRFQKI